MNQNEIEAIEINLLLEALVQRYGYDFRSYARASLERRLHQFLVSTGCTRIAELIPRLLHDEALFGKLAQTISIPVTEMFRDPEIYRAFRAKIVPMLRTHPFIKIWHAGCATGEEVYSVGIVLKEEGLYNRATIFGTDFNDAALAKAREGIFSASRMQDFTRNYIQAGGKEAFSEYYHARYGSAVMAATLRERMTFSNHNLVVDGVFGEMHAVFCRNVLIYFNKDLQNRVLRLLTDSLVRGGYLVIGTKETLRFSAVEHLYECVDEPCRLYRKKVCDDAE